jgi:2-polyprenyl-6-methoxyphenol hydroxylase-like FAD-dependent oxidoreductase
VKILIVGAGPAGLYLAYLLRRQRRDADITLVEQNPPGSTVGFGLVFSERALDFLYKDDPETHDLIVPAMETWRDLTIVHRGERVRIDGIGFAGIGRLRVLELLHQRLAAAGFAPRFQSEIASETQLRGYDLVVGADGVNSVVRRTFADRLGTSIRYLSNKFAWYGTRKQFATLTQTFLDSEFGPVNAHHYSYSPDTSTFLVECAPETWERAGFGGMSEAQSLELCQRIFAEPLGGEKLVSNRSIWRNFPVIWNERWSVDNVVVIGDALRTAHFSIGSGTRLAMEDAIALARAVGEYPDDVRSALQAFEAARRPIVEKLVAAANASGEWYERFPEHMKADPLELAMSYIQRSGRIDRDRLREISPDFVARYEKAHP